jgi:hypothetical protein
MPENKFRQVSVPLKQNIQVVVPYQITVADFTKLKFPKIGLKLADSQDNTT